MPYKCPEKRKESARLRQRKYRERNRQKLNIVALGRYHKIYKKDEEYKEYRKEYLKTWRSENREKVETYKENDIQREKARKRASEWQKNNVGKTRARNALRKKRTKEATPDWSCRKEIGEIYEKAFCLEKTTGIKHHVDHIIPIKHDLVCGLHVPWNLQILPALDNLKKGNKF